MVVNIFLQSATGAITEWDDRHHSLDMLICNHLKHEWHGEGPIGPESTDSPARPFGATNLVHAQIIL